MEITIRELVALGSVCTSFGALGTWTFFNSKGISALWEKKQDIKVCETTHTPITKDLDIIKEDVKEILEIKRNGG